MKLWGLTEDEVRAAATASGLVIHSDWAGSGITKVGRALQFRLGLGSERMAEGKIEGTRKPHPIKYQRRSASAFHSERRVAAVCWHGHYAFMARCFALNPSARILSAFADYRGADDFAAKARSTGYQNVGSPMYPAQMDEVCFCADYAEDYIGSIDLAAAQWAADFLAQRIKLAPMTEDMSEDIKRMGDALTRVTSLR